MSAVWAVVLLQRVSGSGTLYTVAEAVVAVAGAVAVLGLLAGRFTKRQRLTGLAAPAAVVALLAGPAAYSVSAASSSPNGTNPTAGPNTGGGMGGGQRPSGTAGGPGTSNGDSSSAPTGCGQEMGQPPSSEGQIATWVKEHGTAVKASEYSSDSSSSTSTSSGSSDLYRLDASDVS